MKKLIEECRSGRKCDRLSDVIDVYFTEPVAMLFSKIFLKLRVHPNVITLISFIFGATGGVLFIFNNIWLTVAAIFAVLLSIIFDASDGQVARLGTKRSKYGRWFDGICDGLVYAAIYIGVSVRLMNEYIPFTEIKWSWWIFIFTFIVGVFLHSGQARMADYIRNLHMFFVQNDKGTELSRAKALKIVKESYKGKKLSLDKICANQYYSYTKSQEKAMPYTQKLLDAIENGDEATANNAKAEYSLTSDKWCGTTNILTVNLRSYVLFILALLNLHFFIFPFVILILEPFKIILTKRYEKLAKKIYQKYYSIKDGE